MLLEFKNVTGITKGFNLTDISFQIPAGYLVGLAGKNGSGKTTLLHYIADGKKQYTGSIRFQGEELHNSHTKFLNQIAFVADEEWDWDIFFRASEEVDLFSGSKQKLDIPLANLSRGEYLRFQMVIAMAHCTKLYLLDEVTGGMDPVFCREFFRLLSGILMGGDASVLMVTHIVEELKERADYVGILEGGRLKSFGEVFDAVLV